MSTLHLFWAGKACHEKNIMIPSIDLFWVLNVLDAFAKLRKETIRVFMSFRPSDHTEQLSSHQTDFNVIWYFNFFFQQTVEEIQLPLKSDMNNKYFTWKPLDILIISR